MPKFSEIGDTTSVENEYTDKVIIYVEDSGDASAYFIITGQEVRENLEFQAPRVGGAGARAVIERVRAERPVNRKVYGLLDGEAAVDEGEVDQLLLCSDLFFQVNRPELDGLIFLGQHELENLLCLHGDLCGLIEKDVDLRKYSPGSRVHIHNQIASVAQRFLCAALIKYASMTLRHAALPDSSGTLPKTIKSGHFHDNDRFHGIIANIKRGVQEEGLLSWEAIVTEVRRMYQMLKHRFQTQELTPEEQHNEKLRLADGKAVLSGLKAKPHWRTHLATDIGKSDLGAVFRERLLEITSA